MYVVDIKQTRKTNNEATECLGGRTGVDPGLFGRVVFFRFRQVQKWESDGGI